MNKITPFLWFNTEAGDAADFYLSVFPSAKKLKELRSKGVGPWPEGTVATVTIELMGQEMIFLNGGPAYKLNEAFSYSVACDTQEEIDGYWTKLTADGGTEIQCGWLKDKFGLCWQIVPANIGELISTPGGMAAMMTMKKLDIAALEAAGK